MSLTMPTAKSSGISKRFAGCRVSQSLRKDGEEITRSSLGIRGTGETVGLLYVWEDGYEQPMWLNGVCENTALRELEDVPT